LSTSAGKISKVIQIEIPLETKQQLDQMRYLKGMQQSGIASQIMIEGVERKYQETFKKKGTL
jgi:hypothetical protein